MNYNTCTVVANTCTCASVINLLLRILPHTILMDSIVQLLIVMYNDWYCKISLSVSISTCTWDAVCVCHGIRLNS